MEWTKVRDSLPKKDGNYIVTKNHNGKIYVTMVFYSVNMGFYPTKNGFITHWMEQPKPAEE